MLIGHAGPALRGLGSDDTCYATTNRQDALLAVAAEADLVLVLGSVNSSNSPRMVEPARRHGVRAYLVDNVTGSRAEWLAGDADGGGDPAEPGG
ncbi:hypothetical protein [Actinokineospora iranica]|uniref:hypothetical protein n=1 Tax=Actinokineospora iranica TaxID=1271860 RepID=UPI001E2EDC6E|nr:hypothetical protein [Actinokineospora iranica]